MPVDDNKQHQKDNRQASTIIAIGSIIGLTICFIAAISRSADVPIILYAIFGGGILGTDNVIKFIKTFFKIGP